jgi:cytochrome c
MRRLVFLAAVSSMVVGHAVFAADAPVAVSALSADSVADAVAIARVNACMGCHAVDRKLVGPSFQQIAAKYRGDSQAPARLDAKVRDGGSGVWGVIPMPSHPSMNGADIQKVVAWILAGAPSK